MFLDLEWEAHVHFPHVTGNGLAQLNDKLSFYVKSDALTWIQYSLKNSSL